MRTAVRFRLVLGGALCALLAAGLVWGRLVVQDLLLERLSAGMRDSLIILGRTIFGDKPGSIQSVPDLVRSVAGLEGIRVSLIGPSGFVVVDSTIENTNVMENHGLRSEVRAARSGGWGEAIRHSSTLGYRMLYVAMEKHGYVLRMARDLRSVDDVLESLERTALAAGAFLVVVFLGVSTVLVRTVVRPLEALAERSVRWGEGEQGVRAAVSGTDEIMLLASAFNMMAGRAEDLVGRLRSEKVLLEQILATMTDSIVVLDPAGGLILWNEAFCRMFPGGYIRAGMRYYEVMDASRVLASIEGVLATGEALSFSAELPRRMETRVEVQCLPLGGNAGLLVLLRDSTERYQYEKMKAEFAANASHELKTPLAIMDGYVQTLLASPQPDEVTRIRFTQRIASSLDRLRELVSDIILLNRLEEGGHEPKMEQVDLVKTLERILSSLQPRLEASGVRVVPVRIPVRAIVRGNPALLDSLFFNLMENALRYSQTGGRVEIVVEILTGSVETRIRDEGCGFFPGEEERIFERFYRGEGSRARETGGSGLGLAIAKYIVRYHAGTITASSPGPGLGAEFVVVLPFG
ncbi:MAG TPA: ATP-binding protein [Spirochaetota bacterium]|nr:ATP-binding protein [Spirochaetota bacterium]